MASHINDNGGACARVRECVIGIYIVYALVWVH